MKKTKISISAVCFVLIIFFQNLAYAVTYQEIQNDPLNLSLNLKYAKEQNALGNVKNAMVTIERLLLLYPNDLDLTVYYLDILIDLDSVSKASEVVNQLLSKDITNQILLEELELIAENLDLQQKESSPLSIGLTSTVNLGYENNVNSVSTHNIEYAGSVLQSSSSGTVRTDRMYEGYFTLSATYFLSDQHLFSSNVGFSKQDQIIDNNRMNNSNSFNMAYAFLQPRYSINNYISYVRTNNFSSNNIFRRTGGLSVNYNFSDRLSANGGGSVNFTKNNQTKLYSTARAKDARSQQTFLGTSFLLTNNDIISGSLSYNYNKARERYNSFLGHSFQLSYTRYLPFNQNLSLSFSRTANKYQKEDPLIIETSCCVEYDKFIRKDFISNIRMGFNGPLGESTWSYSLNTNWNSAESRIVNYTTSGQTVGLSLIKDFSLF